MSETVGLTWNRRRNFCASQSKVSFLLAINFVPPGEILTEFSILGRLAQKVRNLIMRICATLTLFCCCFFCSFRLVNAIDWFCVFPQCFCFVYHFLCWIIVAVLLFFYVFFAVLFLLLYVFCYRYCILLTLGRACIICCRWYCWLWVFLFLLLFFCVSIL